MKKYLLLALACFGLMAPLSQAQTTADSMTEIAAGRDMELLKTQVAFYHALATMEEITALLEDSSISPANKAKKLEALTAEYKVYMNLMRTCKGTSQQVISFAQKYTKTNYDTGVKMGTAIGNQMTSGYEKSPELEKAVKDLFRFVLSLAEVSLEDED